MQFDDDYVFRILCGMYQSPFSLYTIEPQFTIRVKVKMVYLTIIFRLFTTENYFIWWIKCHSAQISTFFYTPKVFRMTAVPYFAL